METNKTNKVNESDNEVYVKPAIEVYKMELEEGILTGASDWGDNGGLDRPWTSMGGSLPWEK